MEEPSISIIMGVHNLSPRWKDAIKSIRKQTCQDWECIICDDGSSDDSFDKLKKLESKDKRFIIIRNQKNLGLAAALNKCIKYAKGEFIARMDDDDKSMVERLAIERVFLRNHPEYSFVSSNYLIDNGKKLTNKKNIECPKAENFLWTSPFLHPATMFRKEDLERVHGYSEGKLTSKSEDYNLYMKLYSIGFKGYNIQKPLYIYYIGSKNLTRRSQYIYRIYDVKVRLDGFRALKIPPYKYFPFLLKPLVVGLIPTRLLLLLKDK